MTRQTWHTRCRHCFHRYYESITVVHNAGRDWEDSSSFCPGCGYPQESSLRDYEMVDGPILAHHR
jgi:ribosomal protein L37E